MRMLERAGRSLSGFLFAIAALVGAQPVLAQALVTPDPTITGVPGAAAFTGKEWMNFRQDRGTVTAPVATVLGQAISSATAAAAPTGSELVSCVQGGSLKGCSINQITGKAALSANHGVQSLRIIGRHHGLDAQPGNVGTDFSATGRTIYTTGGAVTQMQVCFGNRSYGTTGAEAGTTAPAWIARAQIETTGGQLYPVSRGGQPDIVVPASNVARQVCSDRIGIPLPASTAFYARVFGRVPKPASAPSATAVTGGALPASTAEYYKLTTVDNGLESGGSTEVTATTGASGTLAVTLGWTAPAYGQAVNIYRSTASGGEKFVTQVPIGQTSWTDLGYVSPNAAIGVPAQTPLMLNRYTRVGESGNTQYGGGDGSDQSGVTGAITGFSGNTGTFIPAPSLILGDDLTVPSISGSGDSIEAGVGISGSSQGNFSGSYANWFDLGLSDGQFGTRNFSIGGTLITSLMNGAQNASGRLLQTIDDGYLVSNLGTNDLYTQTWQQIAAGHLALAKTLAARNVRYIPTTLLPKVSTTDNMLTLSGQAVLGQEAIRTNYNLWLRNGYQVDGTGAPVLSGGTPSPYIWKVFDLAASVEVNSSGVATANGGFWMPGVQTSTGTASGTPTVTSLPCSTCTFVGANSGGGGMLTYVALMTSGAAAGQTARVKSASATTLTLFASGDSSLTGTAIPGFTTAPAAGDTFTLYKTYSVDGIHPSLDGHAILGAAWSTWAAANLTGF